MFREWATGSVGEGVKKKVFNKSKTEKRNRKQQLTSNTGCMSSLLQTVVCSTHQSIPLHVQVYSVFLHIERRDVAGSDLAAFEVSFLLNSVAFGLMNNNTVPRCADNLNTFIIKSHLK